jgi:hypothetical protein
MKLVVVVPIRFSPAKIEMLRNGLFIIISRWCKCAGWRAVI